jgi:isopenicillin-N epimerase
VQPLLEPLVISWGWEAEEPSQSRYVDHHEWQGTRDPSAFLAVPEAIEFQRQHNWDAVRERCHLLARQTRERFLTLTAMPPICPDSRVWFNQMFAARLPPLDPEDLSMRLRQEFQIEVLVHTWNDQPLLRASFQGYNNQADADKLIQALEIIIPKMSS